METIRSPRNEVLVVIPLASSPLLDFASFFLHTAALYAIGAVVHHEAAFCAQCQQVLYTRNGAMWT
jgi:hypothetical protein